MAMGHLKAAASEGKVCGVVVKCNFLLLIKINHTQIPSANFLLRLLSLNGKSGKELLMLPLSAHGGFPLFHVVALRGTVTLAGLAGGKGNGKRATRAQIHTGAPSLPPVLGQGGGKTLTISNDHYHQASDS